MDEFVLYPDVRVRVSVPIPEGEERERIAKDPGAMLSLAMSRRSRLPEDLHQSMVMWSFHPSHHLNCKLYFQWVDLMDEIRLPRRSVFDFLVNKWRTIWKICSRKPQTQD